MSKGIDQQVLGKLMAFCAYQERSELEIKTKFKKILKATDNECHFSQMSFEDYIDILKEQNFFNSDRFIEAYVRGKVNLKKWGRIQISHGLLKHGLQSHYINQCIDEEQYFQNLKYLTEKKWLALKNTKKSNDKAKLVQYLLSKGYLFEEISDMCRTLNIPII